MPLSPDKNQEVHGNVDWHVAWVKEIGLLQQIIDEQKVGTDAEWYCVFAALQLCMLWLPHTCNHGNPWRDTAAATVIVFRFCCII
jgi:hypothetical protein